MNEIKPRFHVLYCRGNNKVVAVPCKYQDRELRGLPRPKLPYRYVAGLLFGVSGEVAKGFILGFNSREKLSTPGIYWDEVVDKNFSKELG